MNISFNWLKTHVKLPDSITAEEVADKLKMSTVEVEGVMNAGALLANVVVGKILKCEKHPNADKLKVCEVEIGNEKITIVCGGSNVAEGMLVAVAKNGAKVKWHGEGELVELKQTTIRGVESNGMICGADEIGLVEMFPKKDEKEIVDLGVILSGSEGSKRLDSSVLPTGQAGAAKLSQNDKVIGKPLAEFLKLDDAILEIDNKSLSNRPDLWGHYGMAREVAVLTNRDVENYKTDAIKDGKEIKIKIEIEDTKLCPRYMAVAMSGIKVGESPSWLKERLTAVGLRPINNIVDITNFVMLDVGQPMHAFDAVRIANTKSKTLNPKIVVRRAIEGEAFVTLDGKEHKLSGEMLVIANEEKAIALAGVMGGLESGITNETTTIVFESANFEASSIRKTSTKLGLRTDSSARFEKSLDPNLCEIALQKAVALVLEICPGSSVASKVVDEKHFRLITGPLEVPVEFFAKKIGIEIPAKTIVTTLERLGFAIVEKKKSLSIKIPSWRATKDISIPEDVVEEVVRIFGYDNVPATLPSFPITPPEKNKLRELEYTVADTLVKELGYTEVYNYSFVSAAQIKKLGDDVSKYLELDNPISKEKPYIRRNLLPNLLENIENNSSGADQLKMFEMGKVFHKEEAGPRAESNGDELLPRQDTWLCAMFVAKKTKEPFWEAKRVAEDLFRSVNAAVQFAPVPTASLRAWQHPTRAAFPKIGDTVVGDVYEMHPSISEAYGQSERIGVCSINLTLVADVLTKEGAAQTYNPLSAYPAVTRDIAFLIKKTITHVEVYGTLCGLDPLITKVELFDVYEGSKVAEEYKSMAYHITYAADRTLTTAEIDAAHAKVEKILKEKFQAEVRA